MPGAGGLVATNHIYNVAPKDGTAIAISNKGVAGAAIAGVPEARFDATRITWLGTPFTETSVCFAYNSPRLQVRSLNDLYEKELHVGSLGAGTVATAYPRALAALLGLKFKLVGGYAGSNQIYLAMERGEVEAICEGIDGVIAKRPTWIPDKVITLLLQGGAAPNPDLKDVPFIIDHAKNRRRPAGAGIPLRRGGHRTAVLRAARPAAGGACDAAQRLRPHDAGSGIRRRCEEARLRSAAGERRLSRGADEADGGDAEADQGQGGRTDQVALATDRWSQPRVSRSDYSE